MYYDLKGKSRSTKEQTYTQKADRGDEYPQRKVNNYDNPRHDYKSSQQQEAKPAKQEKSRRVFKYKIERDESGNSRYVLEEPVDNLLKIINYHDIVCIYPSNGAKYYKNVNIYNYKKKIII